MTDTDDIKHTLLLFLEAKEDAEKFEEFHRSTKASTASLSLMCLQTLNQCTFSFLVFMGQAQTFDKSFFMLLLNVIGLIAGWSALTVRILMHSGSVEEKLFSVQTIKLVENIFILAISFYSGIRLLIRASQGACESDEFLARLDCNPAHSNGGLPEETLIGVCMMPLMFAAACRSSSWVSIVLSWTIAFASLLLSSSFVPGGRMLLPVVIVWMPCSIIVLMETRRQSLSVFKANVKLAHLLAENERLAEENHAKELRHMIGNVAHDLKTPLAAFVSGVECIVGFLVDVRKQGRKLGLNRDHPLFSIIEGMEDAITNCTSINSFMLMTINRCIDYTKASNGMKLMPRLETVSLLSALNLPIKIMQTMQSKVDIELISVPRELCSHMITDLQWLQENVLCLLSNAHKYSTNGTVSISVALCCAAGLPISYAAARAPRKAPDLPNFLTAGSTQGNDTASTSVISTEDKTEDEQPPLRQGQMQLFAQRGLLEQKREGEGQDISASVDEDQRTRATVEEEEQEEREDPERQFVLIEIEDAGIGISEEAMRNLFNPFKQAQRMAGGTGLGLYSLAKRMEALGGRFGVCKRKDGAQGSLLWLAIPYNPDAESAQLALEEELQAQADLTATAAAVEEKEANSASKEALADLSSRGAISAGSISSSEDRSHVSAISISSGDTTSSSSFSTRSLPSSPAAAARDKTPTLRILVVDDTLTIRKMASMNMRRQGHTVTLAENGAAAVEIVRGQQWGRAGRRLLTGSAPSLASAKLQGNGVRRLEGESEGRTEDDAEGDAGVGEPFDLILMDLQMPVMDGLEAISRIRRMEEKLRLHLSSSSSSSSSSSESACSANDGNAFEEKVSVVERLCIIAFSANSDDATAKAAYEAGANEFMRKPFSIETFDKKYKEATRKKNKTL